MGLIADFFSSFSRSGAQVTRDIQSVAQRGRVVRRPSAVRPRTRGAGISRTKRRVISSVDRLSKTQSARFVTTQATRIDQAIKREVKEHIPTLRDIQMAGYRYGQKNPEAARLIYGSGNFGAGIVKKAIPKDVGVPVGKAMYAFSDGAIHGVRNDPVKALAFVALPGAVGAVMKGAKYVPIASKIVKSEKAMKAAAYGFDIVYSHNVYTRVNAPVVTHYKDGPVVSETSKTMPDGSIQITQTIKQIPVTRKPNTNEKAERLGYIFSTEAGPMVFGAMGIQKVSKVRFKELGKKGVTTTKKTVKKITKPSEIKKYVKKKRVMREKVPVLKVTPKGKLKILKKRRSQLLKDEAKARGKERKAIQKRIKQVGKDIKTAEAKALKEKVQVLEVTKKGEIKLLKKTRAQLLKYQKKAKGKELKAIQKRLKKVEKELAFKEAFKPSKKVVKLSSSAYNNINRLSKLKAQLKALIAKIGAIPASVAKRIGLNKSKEIKKINVLMRETDAVKTYIVMIQKGTSRKIIVTHLNKLPATELKIIDAKTGKTIKNIESTTKDIELKIKPSDKIDFKAVKPKKKPSAEYKEVKVGKGQVQLQKVKEIQKATTKTIKITKADIKAAERLNAEMKVVVRVRPKTKAAVRIKHRRIQKINTKIKSKQKQLLIYRRQLQANKTKLKQTRTILIALVGKQKPTEKTRTRRIILIIPRYIEDIDHAIAQITKTTDLVAPVQIPKEEIIPTPRKIPRLKPPKKVIVPPVVPVPKLLIPIKAPAKKKKKRKKKGVKEAFVKNPVPSLKAFLG